MSFNSKTIVSAAAPLETMPTSRRGATEFYSHIPLPGQRRVRQLANKIMLLIQKLDEKKRY
jgi:hypothetical protein